MCYLCKKLVMTVASSMFSLDLRFQFSVITLKQVVIKKKCFILCHKSCSYKSEEIFVQCGKTSYLKQISVACVDGVDSSLSCGEEDAVLCLNVVMLCRDQADAAS